MILAGDIGGTNCRLALYQTRESIYSRKLYKLEKFYIKDFSDNQGWKYAVEQFLASCGVQNAKQDIEAICLGMAGPVEEYQGVGRICSLTNVGNPNLWTISEHDLREMFDCNEKQAFIINDMEAIAYAIPMLSDSELVELNPSAENKIGNQALIAAGTGLGQLILCWDRMNQTHIPSPTEGGHSSFAVLEEKHWKLKKYLQKINVGRSCPDCVSYEQVVSGSGLVKIYQFLCATDKSKANHLDIINAKNQAAYITETALSNKDETSVEALNIFMDIFGDEAGNLALKYWAVNGIFIGGGIAPKVWQNGAGKRFFDIFMAAFSKKENGYADKNAMRPVKIITNEDIGLLGSAKCAVSYT
jgi:glucokinase